MSNNILINNAAVLLTFESLKEQNKNPVLGVYRGRSLVILTYQADGYMGYLFERVRRLFYGILQGLRLVNTDNSLIHPLIQPIDLFLNRRQLQLMEAFRKEFNEFKQIVDDAYKLAETGVQELQAELAGLKDQKAELEKLQPVYDAIKPLVDKYQPILDRLMRLGDEALEKRPLKEVLSNVLIAEHSQICGRITAAKLNLDALQSQLRDLRTAIDRHLVEKAKVERTPEAKDVKKLEDELAKRDGVIIGLQAENSRLRGEIQRLQKKRPDASPADAAKAS